MKTQPLIVYLPDRRDVTLACYGVGNDKIGPGVFTYSRLAGTGALGTCPGATSECESICYAMRIKGAVRDIYRENSLTDTVPPIPDECKILRLHVSGDFDTVDYILNWVDRLKARPDVTCWAYTRSWRDPELLPHLEVLRALPNVQLFASMDASTQELPPAGWRRAWIYRDEPRGEFGREKRIEWPIKLEVTRLGGPKEYRDGVQYRRDDKRNGRISVDLEPAYVCPEETGHKKDCLSCGYCFEGQKHDVIFLEH